MSRGFASIGLIRPKYLSNVGGVLRAAQVYGAASVSIQGDRTEIKSREDTMKAWKHIPVFRADDLFRLVPYGAKPIAVDLLAGAIPLPDFLHPHAAFYIFGPEDSTLGKTITERCFAKVYIPTSFCMNLAATVNVVLYDRMVKSRAALMGTQSHPRDPGPMVDPP